MTYRVLLSRRAEEDILRIWSTTRLRMVWKEALLRMNESLAADPMNYGESRDGNLRIGFEGPAVFEVDPATRTAVIIAVWPTV